MAGIGPKYTYRGFPSRRLYLLSSPLLTASGAIAEQGTFNSETVVLCNNDGAVRRGTSGPTPAADIYSPGATYSPWERL